MIYLNGGTQHRIALFADEEKDDFSQKYEHGCDDDDDDDAKLR